ncbi:hypothetical protein D3C85_1446390 [compost metagenome]
MAADPPAHIDITVGPARAFRVYRKTHTCVLLLASAAVSAGHIERYRYQITDFHGLDTATDFNDLAGDFMPEH